MKTARALCVGACVSLLAYGSLTVFSFAADPPQKNAPSTAQAKQAKTSAAVEPGRRRLPNYFGKLGLSDAQKEQAYAIQAKYQQEIEELQKKLKALRARREKELEAILTPEQKEQLDQLTAEAKAARQEAPQAAPAAAGAAGPKSE